MVASKYRICDTENSTQEFKLCSMFKRSHNRKGIMAPMEYTQWFIAPMEKAWFYERFFIEVVMIKYKNAMAKVKKIQYKRYNVNKNFLYYMKWTSVMLPIVFEEFELACIFLLFFSFHCNCQLVKDEL